MPPASASESSRASYWIGLMSLFCALALCFAAPSLHAQQILRAPSEKTLAVTEIQHLLKQGRTEQALAKADALIAAQPNDAHARFLKGQILGDAGRTQEAIAFFTRMTEDFPELPEPYNNLAALYAQQKQYDKARAALEMAVRVNPNYALAHENLGDVYAKLAARAYEQAARLGAADSSAGSPSARARAKAAALAPILNGSVR